MSTLGVKREQQPIRGGGGGSWSGSAQQLGQQQQLQRAWAAPRDPAERVEVSAKFASMPPRTAVHTCTVNSAPGMWDMFHLIRFISEVKGLFTRPSGHMAHNRAQAPRGNEIELLGVLLRAGPVPDWRPLVGLVCLSRFMTI